MSRDGNRYCMFAILSALIFVGIASTGTQAQELPEFYGVYAVHNGKLTELKRNPQSNNYTMTLGGADIIQSMSGITFPDSDLSFIIFSPQVASMDTEIWVHIMAPIRNAPSPSFHIQDQGWTFRVAPIPNQPQMVKLVRKGGTSGGHLALMLPGGFFDFVINQPPHPDGVCVERLVSFIGGGVIYRPCGTQQGETRQQAQQERTRDPAYPMTAERAQQLEALFQQFLSNPPVALAGASLVGRDRYPMQVRIASYDRSSNNVTGEVEWPTLNAVHRIEGSLVGRTLIFREVAHIKKGKAGLGCVYELQIEDERSLAGMWKRCDGSSDSGRTELTWK
jgi:hypothetical protein